MVDPYRPFPYVEWWAGSGISLLHSLLVAANGGSGRHLGEVGRIANCGLARRSRYQHTMAAVQNFEIALRLGLEIASRNLSSLGIAGHVSLYHLSQISFDLFH